MFHLHAIECMRDALKRLRHGQHAKRVSGRRGIDDDEVESGVGGQSGDLDERRYFVNAWQRQRQQSAI